MNDDWLPSGKDAGICFHIDDIHPGKSSDPYEAGGDLSEGALGNVEWLLKRHKDLKVTLFTTPDWREISAYPTRRALSKIPILKDRTYLSKLHPKGKMRLDNHPKFVQYLNSLQRTEIAFHGLNHVHKGEKIPIEFQDQSKEELRRMMSESISIFNKSGIKYVKGICPPGWNAPPNLIDVLSEFSFDYIGSSRDIFTSIERKSVSSMSGIEGVPLLYPHFVRDNLVHIPTNFQATSDIERAFQIIEHNGLVSIKAHIVKSAFGMVYLDGMDKVYSNYLDMLFSKLEDVYGKNLWWTTMGEISERLKKK